MLRFLSHIFSLLLLLIVSLNALAEERVLISGDWKFQYGDDPSWSQPNFNDDDWQSRKVPSLIKQLHKKPITGWYRIHFDAELSSRKQAILIETIRHSDETWLNGLKIGGEGTFEKLWHFNQTRRGLNE